MDSFDDLPPGLTPIGSLPPGLTPIGQGQKLKPKSGAPLAENATPSAEDYGEFFKTGTMPKRASVRTMDQSTGYRNLIRTPEDLASAYGFKATDFDPKNLADEFEKYKSETGERTGTLGSFGLGARQGVQSPVTGGRQLLARAAGNEGWKNIADLRARYSQDILANRTQGHGLAAGLGEVAGLAPWAAPTALMGEGLVAAAVAGALFGATAPVSAPNFWSQKIANTAISTVAAPLAQLGIKGLIAGGTKGIAGGKAALGIEGALPRESQAAQQSIIDALGIPRENVTAADILFRNGVRSNQSRITQFRNLAQQGPSRLSNINEQNLISADRAAANLGLNVGRELETTPFSGMSQLQVAAQNGDKNAARILAELPSGNAPIQRGATEQSSLELEKWLREQNVTGPAYAAIPPEPSTSTINSSNFASYLQNTIATLESKGKSHGLNKPGGPLEALRVYLEDYTGKPGTPAVTAQPTYTSAQQKFIDEMLTNGVPKAKIDEILISNGITPSVAPTSAGTSGVQGMNDLKGLTTLRENIADDIKLLASQGGGNKMTRPLTDAAKILDEILEGGHQTPEWQAFLTADAKAKGLHATRVAKYNDSLLGGLQRKAANMEEVLPDVAANKMLGMTPNQASEVMGAMEPRGQAAMRSNFINDLLAGSRNKTAPEGLQFNRENFLSRGENPTLESVLTPDQLNIKGRLDEALRLLDQMGSPQPSSSGAVDLGTSGASKYKMAKTIFSKFASGADKFLTTDIGKSMLLTLSASKDPALRDTLIQKILMSSEQVLPKQVGSIFQKNVLNPVNSPE